MVDSIESHGLVVLVLLLPIHYDFHFLINMSTGISNVCQRDLSFTIYQTRVSAGKAEIDVNEGLEHLSGRFFVSKTNVTPIDKINRRSRCFAR